MNCALTPEGYRTLQQVILKLFMDLERTGVAFNDDEFKKIVQTIYDATNRNFNDEIRALYYASLVPKAFLDYSRGDKTLKKLLSNSGIGKSIGELEVAFENDTELIAVQNYLFPVEDSDLGEDSDGDKEPVGGEPEGKKKRVRKHYKPGVQVKRTTDNKYYRVAEDRGDQVMLRDGKNLLPVAPGELIPSGLVTIETIGIKGVTPGAKTYHYTVPAKKIKKGIFLSLPTKNGPATFQVVEVLDTVYDYLDNGKVTNEPTTQPITVVEDIKILPKIELAKTPVDRDMMREFLAIDERYYDRFLNLLTQEERKRILDNKITLRQWLEDPKAPGIPQLPKNPGKNFNPILVFENFLARAMRNAMDIRINEKNKIKADQHSSITKQLRLLIQAELLAADSPYSLQQLVDIVNVWKERQKDKSFTIAPEYSEGTSKILNETFEQVKDKYATGDLSGQTPGNDTLSVQIETGITAMFDIEGDVFKAVSPSLTSTTSIEAPYGDLAIQRKQHRVPTEELKFFNSVQRALIVSFQRQVSKGNTSDKYSFDTAEGIYLTAMNLENITDLSDRDKEVLDGAKGAVMVITDKDGVPLRFSETDPNKLDPNGRIAYYKMHKLDEYGANGKFSPNTNKSPKKVESRKSHDKVDNAKAIESLQQEYELMTRVHEVLETTPDAKIPFLITGGSPGYIAVSYFTNTPFSQVTEKVQIKIEKPVKKNRTGDRSGKAYVQTTEAIGTGQWIELERPEVVNTPYFDTIISLMTDPIFEADRVTPISMGTRLTQLEKFIYINDDTSKNEDYLVDKQIAVRYDKNDKSKPEFKLVIGDVSYDVLNDPAAREKAVEALKEKAHRVKDLGPFKDYAKFGFELNTTGKPEPGKIVLKENPKTGDIEPILQVGEFKISANNTYLNKPIKLPEITTLENGTKVYSESATAMTYVDFMKEAGFRVNTPDVASDGTLKRLNPFFTFQAGDAAKTALGMNISAEKQEEINRNDVKEADEKAPKTEEEPKKKGVRAGIFDRTNQGRLSKNYIQKSNNPKATAAQIEKARQWYENHPMRSKIPFEVFFDLMNSTNPNAVAQWTHDGITLWQGADYSDLYHEAWHGFSQLFLTKEMKKDLYAEVRGRKGTFKDHEDHHVFFSDASDLQIEEFLAEEFRKYMLNGHTAVKQAPHQNSFFKLILDILEFFFGDGATFSVTQDVESNNKVFELFNKLKVGNISEFTFNHDNAVFTTLNEGIKATPEHTAEEQTEELFISQLGKEDSHQIRNMVDNYLAEFMMAENANLSDTELSEVYELKTYLALNETKNAGDVITDSNGNRVGTKAELEAKVAALMTAKSHVYTGQLGKNNELLKKGYNKVYERFVKLYKATAEAMAAEEDPIVKDTLEKDYQLLQFAVKNFGNRDNIARNRVKTGAPITGVIGYHLYHSELFFDDKMVAEMEDPDEVDRGRNLSMEGYERKGNETSIKDHLGPEITFLLQTLPEFKDGRPVYGRFQTLKLASLNLTINKMIRRAQNKLNFDDFYEALNQLGKEYLPIAVLLNRLPNPYGSLSDMEQHLWTNLHQKFAKSRNPLIQLTMSQKLTAEGTVARDANDRPIYESHVGMAYNSVNNVKKHWQDNISRGRTDERYRDRDILGFFIDLKKVKAAFPDLQSAKEHKFEFYKAIGINLSDTSELKDILEKHFEIYDPEALYDRLDTMIEQGNVKLTELKSLVGRQYSVYTALAELETEYSDLISTFMATTAEGTVQFEHSLHNYLSMLIHRINRVDNYKELLENPALAHLDVRKTINGEDNLRFNPQAAASTWLKAIFNLDVPESDPTWGERIEHRGVKNTLKLVNLSGTLVRNANNRNRGTALASADIYTKFVSDVHLAFGGYYELIRSADKSTSFGVVVDGALPGSDRKDGAYVPLETFGDNTYRAATVEKVQPHMIAELQRMWRLKQLSHKKDLTEYDFEYLDRGQKFNVFHDYLTDADKKVMQELVDTATSLQQIEDAFRTNPKVITAFKNSTDRYFADQTNKNFAAFKKAGYLSETVKEALANVRVKDDPNLGYDIVTKTAIRFYTHNNFIHNLESTSVIYGDIAQYKHDKEELHKRDAGVNSTGLIFRTDAQMIKHINEQKYQNSYLKANAERLGIENPEETHAFNGQFRTAVIKDMNIRSEYYDAIIAKLGKKEAAKYAGYKSQTEADAQAFITFDAYRKLKIAEGTWENVHEVMFDKIVKGEELDPKKIFKFFPVMKAQYWGPIASKYLPLTGFHKYSLCPIIPSVVKNTNLELVHDRMVKENIDYIVFESGSKISSISRDKSGKDRIYRDHTNHNELVERMNLYNSDIVPEEFEPELTDEVARQQAWKEYVDEPIFTPNVIYLEYLKDQLAIHDTNMGSTIFSTQLRKLIETGLMSDGVPTDFMVGHNNSLRRKKWNELDEDKKLTYHNYALLKKYEGIIEQLAKIAKEKLLDELQWTQDMVDDKVPVTKADLTRLLTFVKQQLKTQGIAEFHLDFINEKNDDLSLSFHSEQIEKMLNAVLVKRLVKQKVHGEALIQIASTLLEKANTTAGTFRVFKPGEPVVPEKLVIVEPGVEISSNATGLAAALTNPTELAKKKGHLTQSYPIIFRGIKYQDSEAAYQALKSTATKDEGPNSTYNLMVEILKAKLEQYPKLVSGITEKGGSAWLEASTHQPTKQNSIWETGGKNWFIKALNEAYSFMVSAAPVTERKTRTKLFNPEDKTLRKGSVVEYNGNTYLFWNLNAAGKAQLIMTNGQKFTGTPMVDKLEVLGAFDTTVYNGTEYIVTDNDNIYSGATGKMVYTGEDNSSKAQKERIIAQAREGLTEVETTSDIQFLGYKGGFENKGKGTPEGDGKDKAMREVADGGVFEVSSNKPSSTATSARTIGILDQQGKTILSGKNAAEAPRIVMLARNGSLKGKPLEDSTKYTIQDRHDEGAEFVVGDMPDVDSQFIDYLIEIGAKFTIYHTGNTPRIDVSSKVPTAEPVAEGPTTGKEIYKRLGEETTYEHVVITPEGEDIFEYWKKFKKEHKNGAVLAYRGKVEFSNDTYPVFPNKFTHLKNKPELVYSGSVKQAVIDYIDWVINSDEEEAVRQRKEYQSGKHKGKPILYYKELGEPSHATAIDYLINKYDWSAKAPVETVPVERIGLRTKPSNDLPFYEPGPDGKTLAMKVKIPLSGDFLHLLKATHKDKKPIGTRERLNEMLKDEEWLNEGDHRQMVTMTAVRIPVQNLNSMEFMEVYEFLDPAISGIVLPTEIVTKAGSDYDVDKLTVMMPSIALINNKPELYKSGLTTKTAKELTEERETINFELREVHEKYDKAITDNIRDFTKEVQRRAKEYVTQIDALYDKIDEAKAAKDEIYKIIKSDPTKKYRYADIKELSGEINNYFEEVKELREELNTLVATAKERDKKVKDLETRRDQIKRELNSLSERAYHNDLISTIREILELKSNYNNLIRPNSTDIYTETPVTTIVNGKEIELATSLSDEAAPWATDYDRFENINQDKIPHPKKEGKYVISPTRTMEVLYNLYKHSSNSVGKAVLGIGAIDNTYNILFNRVGAYLNYQNTKTKIRQRILLPHNQIEINDKKCIDLGGLMDADNVNDISDVISQFINGAVDVAKDAWLFNIQGNRQITPTMMFLLQAGVPLDYIVYMVSNPLIREYVKNQQLYSSTLGALMGYDVSRGSDIQFESQRKIIEDPRFGFPDPEEMFTIQTKSGDVIGPSSFALLSNINRKLSDRKDHQYFKKSELRDRAAVSVDGEITDLDRDIFMHFLQLEKMGSSVRDLKMRTNVDTSRDTSIFDAEKRLDDIKELAEDGSFHEDVIKALKTDSPIAPFFIQDFQVNLLGRLFPLRNHKVLNDFIKDNVTDEYVKATFGNKEKTVAAYKSGLVNFIFQNEIRYFNPIGLKSYHNLPLSVSGAKGITDVDDPTLFDKISVQHVKIEEGVRIVQGKMYVDLGSLLKQYYGSHYNVASIYTGMYGYAPVSRGTFTSPSEYIHFVMEREYMRHVRPLTAELTESPEFLYQGQLVYNDMDLMEDETPQQFDKRLFSLTYETYLRNRALNGILNHNQLFLDKHGDTYAEQFGRLVAAYPELAKHFALINALNMTEKYTEKGTYKNLGMVDPEQDADALGVYNENLYGDMALQYQVNSLTDEAALKRVLPKATDLQIDEIKRFFNMFPVVAFLQSGTNMKSLTSLVPLIKEDTIVNFIQRPVDILKTLMDFAKQKVGQPEANRQVEGYLNRYHVAFYNNNTDRVQRTRGQNLSRNVSLLSPDSMERNANFDAGNDLRDYLEFDQKRMDNLSYDNIMPQFRKDNGLTEDANLYTKDITADAAIAELFYNEHPDKFIVHEKANTMTRTETGQGTFTGLGDHAIPIILAPKGDINNPYKDINGQPNPEAMQKFDDAFRSMSEHKKDLMFATEGYGKALIQKDKYGTYYALETFLYLSRKLYEEFGYVNPLWYEMEDYAKQTQNIPEAFSREASDKDVEDFLKHCNI